MPTTHANYAAAAAASSSASAVTSAPPPRTGDYAVLLTYIPSGIRVRATPAAALVGLPRDQATAAGLRRRLPIIQRDNAGPILDSHSHALSSSSGSGVLELDIEHTELAVLGLPYIEKLSAAAATHSRTPSPLIGGGGVTPPAGEKGSFLEMLISQLCIVQTPQGSELRFTPENAHATERIEHYNDDGFGTVTHSAASRSTRAGLLHGEDDSVSAYHSTSTRMEVSVSSHHHAPGFSSDEEEQPWDDYSQQHRGGDEQQRWDDHDSAPHDHPDEDSAAAAASAPSQELVDDWIPPEVALAARSETPLKPRVASPKHAHTRSTSGGTRGIAAVNPAAVRAQATSMPGATALHAPHPISPVALSVPRGSRPGAMVPSSPSSAPSQPNPHALPTPPPHDTLHTAAAVAAAAAGAHNTALYNELLSLRSENAMLKSRNHSLESQLAIAHDIEHSHLAELAALRSKVDEHKIVVADLEEQLFLLAPNIKQLQAHGIVASNPSLSRPVTPTLGLRPLSPAGSRPRSPRPPALALVPPQPRSPLPPPMEDRSPSPQAAPASAQQFAHNQALLSAYAAALASAQRHLRLMAAQVHREFIQLGPVMQSLHSCTAANSALATALAAAPSSAASATATSSAVPHSLASYAPGSSLASYAPSPSSASARFTPTQVGALNAQISQSLQSERGLTPELFDDPASTSAASGASANASESDDVPSPSATLSSHVASQASLEQHVAFLVECVSNRNRILGNDVLALAEATPVVRRQVERIEREIEKQREAVAVAERKVAAVTQEAALAKSAAAPLLSSASDPDQSDSFARRALAESSRAHALAEKQFAEKLRLLQGLLAEREAKVEELQAKLNAATVTAPAIIASPSSRFASSVHSSPDPAAAGQLSASPVTSHGGPDDSSTQALVSIQHALATCTSQLELVSREKAAVESSHRRVLDEMAAVAERHQAELGQAAELRRGMARQIELLQTQRKEIADQLRVAQRNASKRALPPAVPRALSPGHAEQLGRSKPFEFADDAVEPASSTGVEDFESPELRRVREEELALLRDEVAELRESHALASDELAAVHSDLSARQIDVMQRENDCAALSAANTELESMLAAARDQCSTLQARYDEVEAVSLPALTAQKSLLVNELRARDQQIEQLTHDLRAKQLEAQGLSDELEHRTAVSQNLTTKEESLAREVSKLRADCAALGQKLQASELARQDLQLQLSQSSLASHETALRDSSRDTDAARAAARIDAFEKENAILTEHVNKTRANLAALQTQHAELQGLYRSLLEDKSAQGRTQLSADTLQKLLGTAPDSAPRGASSSSAAQAVDPAAKGRQDLSPKRSSSFVPSSSRSGSGGSSLPVDPFASESEFGDLSALVRENYSLKLALHQSQLGGSLASATADSHAALFQKRIAHECEQGLQALELMRNRAEMARAAVTKAEEQLDHEHQRASALESELTARESALARLNHQLAKSSMDCADAQNELETLKQQLKSSQRSLTDTQSSQAGASYEMLQVLEEKNGLMASLATARKELHARSLEVSASSAQVLKLQSELESFRTTILIPYQRNHLDVHCEAQRHSLGIEVATLNQTLAQRTQQLGESERRCDELQREMARREKEAEKGNIAVGAQVPLLRKENGALSECVRKMAAQLRTLGTELTQTRRTRKALAKQFASESAAAGRTPLLSARRADQQEEPEFDFDATIQRLQAASAPLTPSSSSSAANQQQQPQSFVHYPSLFSSLLHDLSPLLDHYLDLFRSSHASEQHVLSLEADHAASTDRVRTTMDSMDAERARLQHALEDSQRDLESLVDAHAKSVLSTKATMGSELAQAQSKIARLEEDLQASREALDRAHTDRKTLEQSMRESLDRSISDRKSSEAALREQLNKSHEEKRTLDRNYDAVLQLQEHWNSERGMLITSKEDLIEAKADLERAMAEMQQELDEANARLATAKSSATKSAAEKDRAMALAAKEHADRVRHLESSLHALESERSKAEHALGSMQEELDSRRGELARALQEGERLVDRTREQSRALQALDAKLSEITTQLSETQQEAAEAAAKAAKQIQSLKDAHAHTITEFEQSRLAADTREKQLKDQLKVATAEIRAQDEKRAEVEASLVAQLTSVSKSLTKSDKELFETQQALESLQERVRKQSAEIDAITRTSSAAARDRELESSLREQGMASALDRKSLIAEQLEREVLKVSSGFETLRATHARLEAEASQARNTIASLEREAMLKGELLDRMERDRALDEQRALDKQHALESSLRGLESQLAVAENHARDLESDRSALHRQLVEESSMSRELASSLSDRERERDILRAKLLDMTQSHAGDKIRWNDEQARARRDMDALQSAMQNQARQGSEELASKQQEHNAELTAKQHEIASLQSSLSSLQSSYTQLQADHAQSSDRALKLEKKLRDLAGEFDGLARSHATLADQLAALECAYNDHVALLGESRSENGALEGRLRAAEQSHTQAIDKLSREHAQALDKLGRDHAQALDQLARSHMQQLEQVQLDFDRLRTELNAAHASQLDRIHELEGELDKRNSDLERIRSILGVEWQELLRLTDESDGAAMRERARALFHVESSLSIAQLHDLVSQQSQHLSASKAECQELSGVITRLKEELGAFQKQKATEHATMDKLLQANKRLQAYIDGQGTLPLNHSSSGSIAGLLASGNQSLAGSRPPSPSRMFGTSTGPGFAHSVGLASGVMGSPLPAAHSGSARASPYPSPLFRSGSADREHQPPSSSSKPYSLSFAAYPSYSPTPALPLHSASAGPRATSAYPHDVQ